MALIMLKFWKSRHETVYAHNCGLYVPVHCRTRNAAFDIMLLFCMCGLWPVHTGVKF